MWACHQDLIITAPSVVYMAHMMSGEVVEVRNPGAMPEPGGREPRQLKKTDCPPPHASWQHDLYPGSDHLLRTHQLSEGGQSVCFNFLGVYPKSPDSGERLYKTSIPGNRFIRRVITRS